MNDQDYEELEEALDELNWDWYTLYQCGWA